MFCGDNESIPELPYSVLKCIKATFNQGNEKFGHTSGRQCTCIGLFSICFSFFKQVSFSNQNDLEYLIEQGDKLYKSQNTTLFLSCGEPPRNVQVEHVAAHIDFLENRTGMLKGITVGYNKQVLLRNFLTDQEYTGILFLTSGVAVAIIPHTNQNDVYLIDSHSRNDIGKPVPNGTSVILKFHNFWEVCNYISSIYNPNHTILVQYEIQFLKVSILSTRYNDLDRLLVLKNHKSENQKQKCKQQSNSHNRIFKKIQT